MLLVSFALFGEQCSLPVTHRIMLASGLEGGGEAVPSPGASGMINAQPDSLKRPSIVTSSPFTRPTTFIKFDCDMTSSRSGKTAYLLISFDSPEENT
jgi:hypothetical protein